VEADVRRWAPEEAEDTVAALLGDRHGGRLARAPVRVDDLTVLALEELELRPVLHLGRTVEVAVLVQLLLTEVVGPDELRERHGLGRGDVIACSRSANSPG
jgi:hypothetical protein